MHVFNPLSEFSHQLILPIISSTLFLLLDVRYGESGITTVSLGSSKESNKKTTETRSMKTSNFRIYLDI